MVRSGLAVAAVILGVSFAAMPDARAQALVPCAREHEFCRVPYPTRVIYGVPGRSTELFVQGRGIPCANETFGDPAPGIIKRCAFVARDYGRGYRGRGYDEGYREPYREPRREPVYRERPVYWGGPY